MKCLIIAAIVLMSGFLNLQAEQEWKEKILPGHPRIFINEQTLPLMKERANGAMEEYFSQLKAEADSLPENPSLDLNKELYEMSASGKVSFKMPASQGQHLVKYQGGSEALRLALLYLVTGDKKYQLKAHRYLKVALEFYLWCHQHQILADWYNTSRIDALTAYDWLYNSLTLRERREFIVPMLKYVDELQNEKLFSYHRNKGDGTSTGNYGDSGIAWFAGLAAFKDGFDDKTAARLLNEGYDNYKNMMDYRDKVSAGTGLLTAATPGYTFGEYPTASFIFLLSWQSAFNEDISSRWNHMRDYPKWFSWSVIPAENDKLYNYGIGDAAHYSNLFYTGTLQQVYRAMAQSISMYGKKFPESETQAKAVINLLPENARNLGKGILPFILFNFNPVEKINVSPDTVLSREHATYFRSFGLAIMRSGFKPGDTFCLFRAGSEYAHHQHYDENHFTIFKYDFLALDSGTRTQSMHHCYYAPQSVAHNTILIHMEKEPTPPFWRPWGPDAEEDNDKRPAHGGQSSLTGAKCLAFTTDNDYTYVANDATSVYSKEKCREAVRQFVYIYPDYFIIYDRVESLKPEQQKEFLLHTQNEPLAFPGNIFRADNGNGRLFIRTLLPQNPQIDKIGGSGKQFMASGRNWPLPNGEKAFAKANSLGQWRLEVKSPKQFASQRFLHIIHVSSIKEMTMVNSEYVKDDQREGLEFIDANGCKWQVTFNTGGTVGGRIKAWDNSKLRLDKELSK